MKAGIAKYITAVMSLALLGLLVFQFYFIRIGVRLERAEFKNAVNFSLKNLERELRDNDFKQLVHARIKVDSGKSKEEIIMLGDTLIEHNISITEDSGEQQVMVIVRENSGPPPSDSPGPQFKKIKTFSSVSTNHDFNVISEGQTSVTWTSETENVFVDSAGINMEGEVEHFVRELLLEMVPDTLDTQEVVSVLEKTLVENGIDLKPELKWVFKDLHKPAPAKDSVFPDSKNTLFSTTIRGAGMVGPQDLLYVRFPDEDSFLLKKMSLALAVSALLMVTVILCFGWTLRAFIQQRKLSDLKTDFINNMTHELKTPISTISLAAEGLKDPALSSNPEKLNRFAGVILDENERLKQQVERVLEMARLDRGEVRLNLEYGDFHSVIQKECSRIHNRLDEKNGNIHLDLKAQSHFGDFDAIHISGIIYNLLDNALKYNQSAPAISISTRNSQKGILILIKDNGPGIPREELKRIFEKFYRIPTGNLHDAKGFGIGLSYVKAMTEAHGGNITVSSSVGKGTEFSLEFPAQLPPQ